MKLCGLWCASRALVARFLVGTTGKNLQFVCRCVKPFAGRGGYNDFMGLGRMLIAAGVVLIAAGLLLTLAERLPLKLGHLPGDIVVRGRNWVFVFPLVTCILLSAVLSLILWLLRR
jgi:Protein of unknown function (DUF2905)